MKHDQDKSPDTRARAEPHIEEVDHSEAAKGAGQTEKGSPDAERGERMETSKAIARGGKTSGDVPGATAQPPGKKGKE